MQNQSALASISTGRQPQSVAVLLPEEIVDLILAQIGFDYSVDASRQDRWERSEILSDISVIAEGWTRPARRLLVKSVKVWTWPQLEETVPGWAGKWVRELALNA